jgi:hypothetical protein
MQQGFGQPDGDAAWTHHLGSHGQEAGSFSLSLSLPFLDACYAFAQSHRDRAGKLWDGVRRELAAVSALLPLFSVSLEGGRHSLISHRQ